jgi:mono/diheme cytochrome c family protein
MASSIDGIRPATGKTSEGRFMSYKSGFLAAALASTILCGAAGAKADQTADAATIARGKYLTDAGDCVSCHSTPDGKPFAGGLKSETPFGYLISPNITPDKETGIGNYTDDQFYRLMHEGIGPHGEYIYPVMPFPWYTNISRDDVLAIKAYLFSLPPVHQAQDVNHLNFPFNIRTSLFGWRQIYFKPDDWKPDPKKTAEVNRGGYLVEGLGHCAECHTEHNIAGATVDSKAYEGAVIDGWYAPNISSGMVEGIGTWSVQDLVAYLKKGVAPGKGIVAGPMSEVVHKSLSQLSDADVTDIALYLKQLPAKEDYKPSQPKPAVAAKSQQAAAYDSFCSSCHQRDGRGVNGVIPNLAGNGSVVANGPQDILAVIVGGLPAYGDYAAMPAIGTGMTDQQIADAANYVRSTWSNQAPQNAQAGDAAKARAMTDSMLAGGTCAPIDDKVIAPSPEITQLLEGVTESNMLLQVHQLVDKVKTSAGRAEEVNTLTAMYCPVLSKTPSITKVQKSEELGRFMQLVYTSLVQPGGKY